MQTRSITSISALLLGVALVATPVFAADSVDGSKGVGKPVTRDAPVVLPTNIKPLPVPKVEAGSLSRGLAGMDPAAAADAMATITHTPDGTDTETPASGDLRALLPDAINAKGSGSTDRVVSKATTTAPRSPTPARYPAFTVGWLIGQTSKGDYYTCTGTLIGPKSVITAAHCVYDHESGGWVSKLIFVPGATDAQTAPFGTFEWADAKILKGFVSEYDGKNYGSSMPWDLAEIELKEDAGNQIGWQGFKVDDAQRLQGDHARLPGRQARWHDVADQVRRRRPPISATSSSGTPATPIRARRAARCSTSTPRATSTSAASTWPRTTRSTTASA